MSECKFCEAMQSNHQAMEIARSWATEGELQKYGKYMIEYSVAIVKRTWYKKLGKRHAGRSIEYRNKGIGYKLNYCPECGRKL